MADGLPGTHSGPDSSTVVCTGLLVPSPQSFCPAKGRWQCGNWLPGANKAVGFDLSYGQTEHLRDGTRVCIKMRHVHVSWGAGVDSASTSVRRDFSLAHRETRGSVQSTRRDAFRGLLEGRESEGPCLLHELRGSS